MSLTHLQNGRYAVLKKLGEGGKGVVYKARDTVLNRIVAIKILKTLVGEEAYARFMREAQAVGRLNHPNIVTIYDIGKDEEKQFFVLEFVDGMSLRELTGTYPEGKCDIQTALRIAIDVCKALQYAHSQGILHRDIKPENIMLTREDTAKLMDFGLAKMLGQPSLTQEGVIVGTVAYVAPEIALGRGADAKSDLYSFGAVLYESLTGKSPFVGEDPVKVIFSHIHDSPISPKRLNPKVPEALSDCIMKLLEKEPEKRYQSAADLLQVLREIAEGFLREAYMPSAKQAMVVPSPRLVAEREVQLIDRVDEMSLLRQAVDRTVQGEGSLVFLFGEPGIGKTRLTRELGAYARLRGMQVVYGRCPALFRMDGLPPYVLWKEVIRNYLEVCSPEQLYRVVGFYPSEVCKLVPDLAQRLRTVPQSLPITPEHERDRLFEAVSQFVTNISREAPLLVVLDDLQWVDQSSLLLMHYMARGVYRAPMLILGAYRDTDIDEKHVLSSVLTELNRERLVKSVPLKRMSLDDISEMIKRILEQDEVPSGFCELVYGKTRGNPFFVEEVIKSLREEEVISCKENQWKIREVSKIEFPATVKNVIKARIERLDDECQNMLTLASFVGNDFSFAALCGVTGLAEDKVLDLMERMLKTGLVKERVIRGEDVYSFADIVVRDVVHEEVSHLRHKKLHGAVGLALEKIYEKKIDEHLSELALHFLESGDEEKALSYFLKAGDKARNVYAFDEAISYFQHALQLIEEKGDGAEQKANVTEWLGDLLAWTGKLEEAVAQFEKSLQLWNQLGNKRNAARLHIRLANQAWLLSGDKEKASEHHRMALEILEKEQESVELASLYENIAHMLWRSGSPEAWSWAKKALELAERVGATEVVGWCYNDLATFHRKSGEFEKASEYYEHGLKTALDNNFASLAITFYNNVTEFYYFAGAFEKAAKMALEGSEYARKVGSFYGLSWLNTLVALGHVSAGELRKGITVLEDNLALAKRIKHDVEISGASGGLGYCYLLLGEFDKSLQFLKESLDIAKRTKEYQFSANATQWLGELFMEMEDYDEAERYLHESENIYKNAGETSALSEEVFPDLAKLYLRKGEIEKTAALVEKVYDYAEKARNKLTVPYADMLKGMLLREQKNYDESIRHFEKSLHGYKALNAQEWYVIRFAELLYEYGLAYLERNDVGDREKAYSLLSQALAAYQKMDAKRKIEMIIAKKKLLTS